MSEKPHELEMPTVEVAAAPSPELLAALRRKAWLKKREEEGGDPPADAVDPQAWRFEVTDTSV
jgi:hypothetical protein